MIQPGVRHEIGSRHLRMDSEARVGSNWTQTIDLQAASAQIALHEYAPDAITLGTGYNQNNAENDLLLA